MLTPLLALSEAQLCGWVVSWKIQNAASGSLIIRLPDPPGAAAIAGSGGRAGPRCCGRPAAARRQARERDEAAILELDAYRHVELFGYG